MKVFRWDSSGLGFTWSISIVGTGILMGRVRTVSTRNGLRIVRSVYLVPKRSREYEKGEELVTEWYTVEEFSRLVANELKLLSLITESVEDPKKLAEKCITEVEKLRDQLQYLRTLLTRLLEVVSGGESEEK